MGEYITLKCDQCGEMFEKKKTRVLETSDIVFCRKSCYCEYMDEWGDRCNNELLQSLPGPFPEDWS